jgi:NAD(P)H-quinone oxidoreductase subunit 5
MVAAGLLVLAAMGKSAQVPFSGWLPRAMEGPTPSSAIFYGAISVHLGVYLLLRVQPLLQQAPLVQAAVVIIGLITAIHATMSSRAAADAKTSLAYASLAQISLIFIEAGMGWSWLALVHTVSHAALRTLQFLRAPSMLHDYHRVHAAAGGQVAKTGTHYEALLTAGARRWMYRMALDRGHFDTLLDRFVTGWILRAAASLAAFEAGGWAGQRRVRRAENEPDAAPGEVRRSLRCLM